MRISHYGGMDSSVGIIEAIKKDRTAGAVRLVAEYKDRLYGAALGLCENASEAEDLVFRTFEQVIAKIDTYREDEAFFKRKMKRFFSELGAARMKELGYGSTSDFADKQAEVISGHLQKAEAPKARKSET